MVPLMEELDQIVDAIESRQWPPNSMQGSLNLM
jgi:hypothetical protein